MMIKDEAMFMRKAGSASPVMDGLYIWIDGQDPLVTCSTESVSFLDRISGTALEATNANAYGRSDRFQFINESGFLILRAVYQWTGTNRSYIYSPYGKTTPKTVEIVGSLSEQDGSPTTYHQLIAGSHNTGLNGGLWIQGNSVSYGYDDSTTGWTIVKDETPTNVSHQYTLVVDAGRTTIYKDGVVFYSSGIRSFYPTDETLLTFVTDNGTTSAQICIGSVRYYDRALTESEILQNYSYEKSLGRVE